MNKFSVVLPPLSRFSSRKQWEEACWEVISKSKKFLDIMTTPYERRNIVLRAAVLNCINSGKRYRQIGEELWLSPQTISSIKKSLGESRYKSYRERGKSERKRKIYSKNDIQKKGRPSGRPVRTKYGTLYV